MTHGIVTYSPPCSCKDAKRPPLSGYVQVPIWETAYQMLSVLNVDLWLATSVNGGKADLMVNYMVP